MNKFIPLSSLKDTTGIVELCNKAGESVVVNRNLFRVKSGKGTLTHRISEEDEEYMYSSQLLLNDRPLIQANYRCGNWIRTCYIKYGCAEAWW